MIPMKLGFSCKYSISRKSAEFYEPLYNSLKAHRKAHRFHGLQGRGLTQASLTPASLTPASLAPASLTPASLTPASLSRRPALRRPAIHWPYAGRPYAGQPYAGQPSLRFCYLLNRYLFNILLNKSGNVTRTQAGAWGIRSIGVTKSTILGSRILLCC